MWSELPNVNGGETQIGSVSVTYPAASEVCPYITLCPNSDIDLNTLCGGNGYCMNSGICLCKEGYNGEGCENKECSKGSNGLECSGNGECINGECVCYTGFSGILCELIGCPNDCTDSVHGTCNTDTGVCTCNGHYFGDDCAESYCPPEYDESSNCNNNGICEKNFGICSCNTIYNENNDYVGYYTGEDCSESYNDTTSDSRYIKLVMNDYTSSTNPIKFSSESVFHSYQYYESEITSASYNVYIIIDNIVPSDGDIEVYASFISDPPNSVNKQYSGYRNGSSIMIQMIPKADGSPFTDIGKIKIGVIGASEGVTRYDIYVVQDPCQDPEYSKCNTYGVCIDGKCECDEYHTGNQCNLLKCYPECIYGKCKNNTGVLQCDCDGGYIGDSCNIKDTTYSDLLTLTNDEIINGEVTDVGCFSVFMFDIDLYPVITINITMNTYNITPIIVFKYQKYPKFNDYDIFFSNYWIDPSNNIRLLLDSSIGLLQGKWYMGIYNSLHSQKKLESYTVLLHEVKSETELKSICVGSDNVNYGGGVSCMCKDNFIGQFCEKTIHFDITHEYDNYFKLPIGSYYYIKDIIDDNSNYIAINMTNLNQENYIGADPLLLVSTDSVPTLESSNLIDYYSISLSNNSQIIYIKNPTTNIVYITLYNRNTAYTAATINLRVSFLNDINLENLECDNTTECVNYSKECYYHGSYFKNECVCLSGWIGLNCNTPQFKSVQSLIPSTQNIKYLCNKCGFTIYMNRGEFIIYTIYLPLKEDTELIIQAKGENNTDPDIFISPNNPKTIYDFTIIHAYHGSNEEIRIKDKKLLHNKKIYLALYSNYEGYYNIIVETIDNNPYIDGKIINELIDWISGNASGAITFFFFIVLLILPVVCLIGPVCSSEKQKKIKGRENIISSNLDEKSNYVTPNVQKPEQEKPEQEKPKIQEKPENTVSDDEGEDDGSGDGDPAVLTPEPSNQPANNNSQINAAEELKEIEMNLSKIPLISHPNRLILLIDSKEKINKPYCNIKNNESVIIKPPKVNILQSNDNEEVLFVKI